MHHGDDGYFKVIVRFPQILNLPTINHELQIIRGLPRAGKSHKESPGILTFH